MRNVLLVFVLILLSLVTVFPALAQDDTPDELPDWLNATECQHDISGQELTLWSIGDLSGPYGPITQPLLAGFEDAAEYFNARGGICGAMITLPDPTTIDTGGDQNQTSVIYSRVAAEDPNYLILYSSDDAELLREQLEEDQIAGAILAGSVVGLYGGEEVNYDEPGWNFATNPLYPDQLGSFCDYAADNLEDPVIGYLSWPTAFGRAAFTPEVIDYCAEQGVGFVEEPEFFAPGSDIRGQIENLVDGGANILYTNSLASGPAEIAAAVTNMGIRDQVTLAGVNWVLDTSVGFLGQATIGPDGLPSVNGLIGSIPFYWWTETEQPGIALLTEMADANDRDTLTRNIAYSMGFAFMDLFREMQTRALNEVGPGNVDGQAIYNELAALSGYAPLGLFEVDYQGGELRAVMRNRIGELRYLGENGGPAELPDNPPVVVEGSSGPVLVPIVVPLTDWVELTDLRPGQWELSE